MAAAGPRSEPTTRSRTSLFLSYRDSAARPTPSTPFTRYAYDEDDLGDEEANLIGHGDRRASTLSLAPGRRGAGPDTATLPPKWVDLADQVDAIVRSVKPKIAHLDKLHAKHLLPGFKDRTAEEREIESLATSITADFRTCQSHIRRIAEQSHALLATRPRDAADAENKRIDLLLAANVQTALATKVQDLSTAFRKKQAGYLRQLKGNESKAVELQHRAAYDPLVALADDEQASSSALAPGTPSAAQQAFFSPSSSLAASSAADQRSSEIASIAHSIADLADMFKDLSSLVIDQGTLLDRVDYNVEVMREEVRGAVDELSAATRHQRRSGKCQLLFLLLLSVLACLIFLSLRPPRFARAPSPSLPAPGRAGEGGGAAREGMASNEEIAQKLSEELGGVRWRVRRRPGAAAAAPASRGRVKRRVEAGGAEEGVKLWKERARRSAGGSQGLGRWRRDGGEEAGEGGGGAEEGGRGG
ncbi:t-SNARE affecting a late Golgi compartment protein 2 [Rhodotorula kratochvilovae]